MRSAESRVQVCPTWRGVGAFKEERGSDPMDQFCIYFNPSDFPGRFVVRRWRIFSNREGRMQIEPDKEPEGIVDTIEAARALIPCGLCQIPRAPQDDPSIVEVWI